MHNYGRQNTIFIKQSLEPSLKTQHLCLKKGLKSLLTAGIGWIAFILITSVLIAMFSLIVLLNGGSNVGIPTRITCMLTFAWADLGGLPLSVATTTNYNINNVTWKYFMLSTGTLVITYYIIVKLI